MGDRILVLTPRPTVLEQMVAVDLPRPRDQIKTKELPEFAHLRALVYRSIKKAATAP
jgi:NitT/TauT family transport system ATP-binding protein